MRGDADRPVKEDMAFQRAEWIAERIGWSLMGLVTLVALIGLFGSGPLSRVTANDASGRLTAEYERFQRATVTTRFTFRVAGGTDPVELRLGPAFTRRYEIDSMQPAPVRSTQGSDGLHIVFAAPREGAFTAVLWCRPRSIGFGELAVALGTGAPILRTILVYP